MKKQVRLVFADNKFGIQPHYNSNKLLVVVEEEIDLSYNGTVLIEFETNQIGINYKMLVNNAKIIEERINDGDIEYKLSVNNTSFWEKAKYCFKAQIIDYADLNPFTLNSIFLNKGVSYMEKVEGKLIITEN